ncbi:MAG: isopeptide-forming domain-containing fimbrial protein [Lachnospiraceae bacterium]|nr:isopeptide-forming domain-containing fimbrial protein [Lachnospiraceae bacterium]
MKTYLKKISALLLALVMVMGMCVTAGAATTVPTSDITVTGLSDSEATTVTIYQLVEWDETEGKWMLTANGLLFTTQAAYDADSSALTTAVQTASAAGSLPSGLTAYTTSITTQEVSGTYETTVTFDDVDVGAYLIVANGNLTEYSYMIAETYDDDEPYMAAEDVTIVAKGSGYDVSKEQNEGDTYVETGDTVTFTVTTTFPYFSTITGDETYYIVDTPEGLSDLNVISVTIGGTAVSSGWTAGYYNSTFTNVTASGVTTDNYIIDLTDLIGTENKYAGQSVVIKYTAIVTAEGGYKNAANAYKGNTSIGEDTTEGYSGGIKITKTDASGDTLEEAEFSVYKLSQSVSKTSEIASTDVPMYFVYVSEGVYRVATDEEITAAGSTLTQTIVVASDGTVTILGLEADYYYHFAETKAPAGYSINESGVTIEVTKNDAEAYTKSGTLVTGTLTDTKLSSLPSTGGFGTYLFTIVGVVVMAVMASLYFIKRRRDASEEAKQ